MFNVTLNPSMNCGGSATVIGTLYPNLSGMTWSWDGIQQQTSTKTISVYYGGSPTVVGFQLGNLNAQAGGTLQANASLGSLPGCEARAPYQGASATANLTVTQ